LPANRRAVVFDFDGTLFDSLPLVLRALKHALAPYVDEPPTMAIFARLGGPPASFMPQLVGHPRQVPAALRRLDAYHREHSHLLRPFDGARGMLEVLHARGVPLAIWTGRDRESADWLLHENRLADLFNVVVCGDDLPTHKPDPQGLREILTRLGVAPAEALFIGDADVDVLAGHACSVSTVLIRQAREVPPEVRAKAWREVVSPAESYELALAWAEDAEPKRQL
jgi:phosphoglycolate phosphatase/pyrophosphatase PpaX